MDIIDVGGVVKQKVKKGGKHFIAGISEGH